MGDTRTAGLFLCMIAACTASTEEPLEKQNPPAKKELMLLFTGNVGGKLEPCG